jgi:predicted XRE-type DNA-binding protein
MENDLSITRGSGNVFADIGVSDPEEALFKAQLVATLRDQINAQGLTQSAAALKIGVAQPDLSKLLKGRVGGFSLERLLEYVMALGNDIEVKVRPINANRAGRMSLKVA